MKRGKALLVLLLALSLALNGYLLWGRLGTPAYRQGTAFSSLDSV